MGRLCIGYCYQRIEIYRLTQRIDPERHARTGRANGPTQHKHVKPLVRGRRPLTDSAWFVDTARRARGDAAPFLCFRLFYPVC